MVHVITKRGPLVRSRPTRWRATPGRTRPHGIMHSVASHWRMCTKQQKTAWTADGKKANLSGFHRFCQINYHRAEAGLPLVMDPPKPAKRGSHTVVSP